jgi:hypothetical protein
LKRDPRFVNSKLLRLKHEQRLGWRLTTIERHQ